MNDLYNVINGVANPSYKEILKLDQMLTERGIPHTLRPMKDGWQVIYTGNGSELIADAIEHYFSYGSECDLLEIYGLLTPEEKQTDDVLGYLTAVEVFRRIENDWKNRQTESSGD